MSRAAAMVCDTPVSGANNKAPKTPSRKPRAERVAEITTLAAGGHRVSQIAEEIGISPETVRLIAKQENIDLPDRAIRGSHNHRADRIVRETVMGLVGYRMALGLIAEIDGIAPDEARELLESLKRSLRSLKHLETKLGELINGEE